MGLKGENETEIKIEDVLLTASVMLYSPSLTFSEKRSHPLKKDFTCIQSIGNNSNGDFSCSFTLPEFSCGVVFFVCVFVGGLFLFLTALI